MTFRVGQKVTLKYPHEWRALRADESGPIFGNVYVIRDMEIEDGDLFLSFDEIRNPERWPSDRIKDCTFWAERFRPIVERKTDISIFTKMLTGNRVNA